MQGRAEHGIAGQGRAEHGIALHCRARQRKDKLNYSIDTVWVFIKKGNFKMIREITLRYIGLNPILQNNPQCVDPLNPLSKELQKIHKKRNKTEEDILHRYDLEIASKIYWNGQIVVPTTWVTASVCKVSHKIAKIPKAEIRSAFIPCDDFVKLKYKGVDKVKTKEDIIKSQDHRHLSPIKQGQVKVMKAVPMFRDWSFEVSAEYDDTIIDEDTLVRVAEYGAKTVGFGDFRPTFGRCKMEVA